MLLEVPLEIQHIIYNKCIPKDLRNLAATSSSFYNSVGLNQILWSRICIVVNALKNIDIQKDSSFLARLSQYTRDLKLQSTWDIYSVQLDGIFTAIMKQCCVNKMHLVHAPLCAYQMLGDMNLTELRLEGVRMLNDEHVHIVCERLTKLQVLSIDNTNNHEKKSFFNTSYKLSSEKAFDKLDKLPQLREIFLCRCPIRQVVATQSSVLNVLELRYCEQLRKIFSNDETRSLKRQSLKSLERLSVMHCRSLTDASILASVHHFGKLKKLSLGNLPITDAVVDAVCAEATQLEEIDVGVCSKLTDKSLRSISNVRSLKKINIQCAERTRSDPAYSNAGLVSLLNLSNLEVINLKGHKKNGNSTRICHHLSSLMYLKELYLGFCRLDEEDIRAIAKVKTLIILDLQSSCQKIQDDILLELSSLKSLERLVLGTVRCLTRKGIDELKRRLPNLLDIKYRMIALV